ncbi:hypothetical protein [Cellulophaga sp. L1A9]|uniref:hypothetical protein n=2 Tax=unclassified Cellulophaga TaxID=2634405 RepID=UPI00131E9198|nr:hypothetical protein [Cellulophaga sp. L1A9]
MKYKFNIMTNYPSDLEKEMIDFNNVNNTDLKLIQVLNDEVTFVEVETSMSDELLFKFGTKFGYSETKKNIEGRI